MSAILAAERHPHPIRWTRPQEDALLPQLRGTVRAIFSRAASLDGAFDDVWAELTELAVWDFGLPIEHEGMDLGFATTVMVAEEAGRVAFDSPLIDSMLAAVMLSEMDGLLIPAAADLLGSLREGAARIVVPPFLPRPSGTLPSPLPVQIESVTPSGDLVLAGEVDLWDSDDPARDVLLLPARDGHSVALVALPVKALDIHRIFSAPASFGSRRVILDLSGMTVRSSALLSRGIATERVLGRAGVLSGLLQAGYLVGLAEAAVNSAGERMRARSQFGRPISEHQSPRLRLAHLICEVDALREAVLSTAAEHDNNPVGPASVAGLLAQTIEVVRQANQDTMHLHGASGLLASSPSARLGALIHVATRHSGRATDLWRESADFL